MAISTEISHRAGGKIVIIALVCVLFLGLVSAILPAPPQGQVQYPVDPAAAAEQQRLAAANQARKITEARQEAIYNIAVPALQSFKLSLRDPDSARFRDVWAVRSSTGLIAACGVVNATNAFGAFTGETPFIAMSSSALTPGQRGFPKLFEELCIQGEKVMKLFGV